MNHNNPSSGAPEPGPLPEPDAGAAVVSGTTWRPARAVWTAYSAEAMHAYRLQELAAERERIKARLLAMHDEASGRHNYYAHAALVIFGEKD